MSTTHEKIYGSNRQQQHYPTIDVDLNLLICNETKQINSIEIRTTKAVVIANVFSKLFFTPNLIANLEQHCDGKMASTKSQSKNSADSFSKRLMILN